MTPTKTRSIRVRVYHSSYGCDTGCCGHIVELTTPDGDESTSFEFEHPCGAEGTAWGRRLAEETIRDNWPNCLESIDWDSLAVEAVDD